MKINTKNYEDIITQVKIDDREQDRKDYAMEQYAPFNPSIEHLDVGDYIFIGENGIEVVVEYKKDGDFLSSVVGETNHLHNQTYDMVTNFEYSFIMIECEDLRGELNNRYYQTGQDISFPQLNGAIAQFNTVSTVLFAQTQYQAFDLMMRQAGKLIMQKPMKYKFGKKTKNSALNYLSAIKGLDKRAEEICNELNLKSLQDLLNLTKEDLTTVNGVGSKKAEMILYNIHGDDLHGREKN
ncbi:MAG: hypothetical protein IJF83_10960 [Methanobrevibacter sp.]|nr:hypothetical protein [Methanobrevibacter sp.]